MVTQPCVCPKCKGIVHFKMVNFMLYILFQFFLKEKKKRKKDRKVKFAGYTEQRGGSGTLKHEAGAHLQTQTVTDDGTREGQGKAEERQKERGRR